MGQYYRSKIRRRSDDGLTFQCVAARPDEQPDEFNLGVLLLRNHDLLGDTRDGRLVVDRRLEVRIKRHHLLDHVVALLLQFTARAELSRVQPLAVHAVDRFR